MQNEISLFQKVYDFYKEFYLIIDHFPTKSRLILAAKIEKTIIDCLESITKASFASSTQKIKDLQKASAKIDFLKILFRLCVELKIINRKKYIFFESLVSPKLSETIARETGTKTMVLDPIEGIIPEDLAKGYNYITVMESNLKNLELVLQCKQ